jgi:hypothetical protein
MNHKGVEYTLTMIEPGVWKWEFRIEQKKAMAGKVRTNLRRLAQRRAEAKIDLFLKQAARTRSGKGLDLRQ